MKIKQNFKNELTAIYGRVSSREQAEGGLSLAMQKDECTKYSKHYDKDCSIVYFEDAGKTGSNMSRTGISNLLNLVKMNKVKKIVVWKLDRLSRCQEDFFGIILKTAKEHNCTIASVSEGFHDI